MNTVEVLILHGSPGSGKSTLARALFERMRETERVVAVIDPDELNLLYPHQGPSFPFRNLKAIWPNYAAVDNLRAIIPLVIADATALTQLQDALPGSKLIICELTAPQSVLKHRVSEREPNEYWKKRLEAWVGTYHERDGGQQFGDMQVITDGKSVEDTVTEILEKAGW